MYKIQTYNPVGEGVFNPNSLLRLVGFNVDPLILNLPVAGGLKLIRNMSTIATDGKILKRSKLLTDAAAADTGVYVTNPWAFAIGDVLKVIAAPNTSAAAELAAITGGTGANLGTITGIESAIDTQINRLTLGTAVVGNIITISFLGVVASYQVASAVVADENVKLAAAITKAIASCDSLRYVSVKSMGSYVKIESTQAKQIVEFAVSIAQGTGASLAVLTTSTDKGLGRLTLSTPLAAPLTQGTKIGTVNQVPLGIFDGEYDFTDYLNTIPTEHAITPCYGGQFYLDAMPYIDGQITKELVQAKFIPAYDQGQFNQAPVLISN